MKGGPGYCLDSLLLDRGDQEAAGAERRTISAACSPFSTLAFSPSMRWSLAVKGGGSEASRSAESAQYSSGTKASISA
jgi:hypothetical protein